MTLVTPSGTVAVAFPSTSATVEVHAPPDQGDVAGTVTFTGGAWTSTVALVDGKATATVPDGVTSVTATYDGYRDGLVTTSASAAAPVDGLAIGAAATVRCVAGKGQAVVTLTNTSTIAATVTVTTPYGSKQVSLAAGATTSAAFATRLAVVPAGTATIAATGPAGQSYSGAVAIPAALCG